MPPLRVGCSCSGRGSRAPTWPLIIRLYVETKTICDLIAGRLSSSLLPVPLPTVLDSGSSGESPANPFCSPVSCSISKRPCGEQANHSKGISQGLALILRTHQIIEQQARDEDRVGAGAVRAGLTAPEKGKTHWRSTNELLGKNLARLPSIFSLKGASGWHVRIFQTILEPEK